MTRPALVVACLLAGYAGRFASSQSPRGGVTRLGAADAGDSVVTPKAFWLVVVSDVATSASEVRAQLQAMKLDFSSVKAELEALPKALVGNRAGSWAAYYAGTK